MAGECLGEREPAPLKRRGLVGEAPPGFSVNKSFDRGAGTPRSNAKVFLKDHFLMDHFVMDHFMLVHVGRTNLAIAHHLEAGFA